MARESRYFIFYIQDADAHKLMQILEKYISDGHGEVFYPCMEYYRRGDKAVKVRAIFPGYVFLYTDLNVREVHQLLRAHRAEINAWTKELGLSERWMAEPDFLFEEETKLFELSDIADDERVFVDTLREGNGLLAMSSGYEYRVYEDDKRKGKEKNKNKRSMKKWVVMEGPLKVYQDLIVDVDKHNRKAFLRFEINGRRAQAGFCCLPKAHWFPNRDANIVQLTDGTEFDINELKRSVMTVSK